MLFRSVVESAIKRKELMGRDQPRCMFFLFLNVDMPLKEYICDPSNVDLYLDAFNCSKSATEYVEHMRRKHYFDNVRVCPLEQSKAITFYKELRGACNRWLSDESLTCSDFVHMVKELYLVS